MLISSVLGRFIQSTQKHSSFLRLSARTGMGLFSRPGARGSGVQARGGAVNIHVIKMPDLGEGIAEVELLAWRVQPGDSVAEDQVLADVMTDKATVEIPSPVAGRVLALGGEVGQLLAVGAELIRIELDGTGDAVVAPIASLAQAPSPIPPSPPLPPPTPTVPPPAPVAAAARSAPSTASHDRPVASPALRARAWESGVDLNDVPASGTAGRIVQADLDAYNASSARGSVQSTPLPARVAAQPEATHDMKIVGLRRKIAQKMQESKRRIPHFTYVEEVDVSELEALRERLNANPTLSFGTTTANGIMDLARYGGAYGTTFM